MELTKKDTPHPKTKEKPQWDGRRGAITTKSNPITAGWVTHKLDNNYTTKVHPLEWRFWAPRQSSQPGGPAMGGGIPENQTLKASRIWLQDFDRTGENRDSTLEGHKVVCASGPRGKEQWPHRRLNQTYLLVLEGLLQRRVAAVAHHRDKDIVQRSSGKYSWREPSWSLPLASAKSPQAPVLGRFRPNNQQEGNSAPPISRQVIKV